MFKFLKGVVGGSGTGLKDLPYNIGEPYSAAWGSWVHYRGTSKVHSNVCLASVVVTQTLDWKLHAFDVLSEFDGNAAASNGPMLQYEWLIGAQYKPQELLKSDWAAIRKSPQWSIDSWGMGCLIYELFSGAKLGKTEELRNTASIPKVVSWYDCFLSIAPS